MGLADLIEPQEADDFREAAICDLCSQLFAQPDRLVQTLTHTITETFTIEPHTHDDVMQFDLLAGCGGRVWVGDKVAAIGRITALVARPGEKHGYVLEPGESPSRVYHFKLRVDPSWPAVSQAVYPPLTTGLSAIEPLVSAVRGVVRLGIVEQHRPPLLMVRLAEVLCLWPMGKGDDSLQPSTLGSDEDAEIDQRMASAFELIERRLHDPPSLEELARSAHFSSRHFSRRFRRLYGCTPHTYLTARRFALARQMLSQERLKVTQIADSLGFGSVATFSRWFTQQAGVSPSHFREDPTIL